MTAPDPTGLAARESGAALGPLPIACPHCGDELTAAERDAVRCGRCVASMPERAPSGSVVAEARALLAATRWALPLRYDELTHEVTDADAEGERVAVMAWADGAAFLVAAPRLLAALCDEATALRERAELAEARFREATDHVSSLLRREQEQRERAERAEQRLAPLERVAEAAERKRPELEYRASIHHASGRVCPCLDCSLLAAIDAAPAEPLRG